MNGLATPPDCKRLGAFYTPSGLAEWVAAELLDAASSVGIQVRNAVDPACGDGALLEAIHRLSGGAVRLTGIDVNPEAAAQCLSTLGPAVNIVVGDALDPDCQWGKVPPDTVIINPPWGSALQKGRQFYRDKGYSLAFGQSDISDLFVERALTITKPGALLGFILPDTLFQPEHQALREMLLKHTLLLIARLGEGLFDNVFRSTVVMVVRNGAPKAGHLVQCLQIPASQRKLVGRRRVSFKRMKELYSHDVPQARFMDNPRSVFNIAQNELDYHVFQKFSSLPPFDWMQRVHLGRGVEIGKRGITFRCQVCGNHRALPAANGPVTCPSCGATIGEGAHRYAMIAELSRDPGWYPLIVGEDVDRYSASLHRSIKLGVPGIRYKPMEHFASKKLLIRKTGVGLRAAVDKSGAATIQTVFYVVAESPKDQWVLDYLQGVINSRPLLAWYLRWSGENRWRSHPYVTPKILRALPIPDPFADQRVHELARRIAEESTLARDGLLSSDHAVDDLVCQMYELGSEGAAWVDGVLQDTEDDLEYFMRMKTKIDSRHLQNRVAAV